MMSMIIITMTTTMSIPRTVHAAAMTTIMTTIIIITMLMRCSQAGARRLPIPTVRMR